jgi:hypothetical protein
VTPADDNARAFEFGGMLLGLVFDIQASSRLVELTYSPAFAGSFAFGERARFEAHAEVTP